MTLRFLQKWHGAGNDFLVDVLDYGTAAWWTADRVRAACDRHHGVGADGVVVAEVGAEGHAGHEVVMSLFNADGSRAEMSGNGIRCLAAGVRRATRGRWTELDVLTDAGLRTVEFDRDDPSWATVDMGEVELLAAPAGAMGAARVGNPHVVVLDEVAWSDAERDARAADLSAAVGGANVEFVRLEATGRVAMRVHERGVGWTMACGTGSCAVAAVLRAQGRAGDRVVVANPGGDLEVSLLGARARLRGPVAFVGNVEWSTH